jgi:flavin reductase (DIM6/NTAB) family NADH-FMN oxidoreductase RutF
MRATFHGGSMIENLLGLGLAVANYLNTKESKEFAENMLSLKTQRMEELARGQECDDGVIEMLEQKIKLQAEAIQTYLNTQAGK